MKTVPLLKTKLYVPPLRPKLVERPRLVAKLDEGLRLGRRLSLVSAPAGFGKTTLVTEWVQAMGGVTPPIAVAWLSLDEGDNDPVRFFAYFIAALQRVDETVGQATQSLLGAPQLPPVESLMTLLVNEIDEASTPFVLVLDDCQLLHTDAIHDALAFLLNHQPPRMHTVIATRADPPLPLPRLRARGQVTEIRADDLRFAAKEVAAFLEQALELTLDAEMITTLEARTEGWIAGLQLAALSMKGREAEGLGDFVAGFGGSHRHVIDYLAGEVLAQQSGETRTFLQQTGILDHLCASLCDAITGRDDSATMLGQLEQANLFLVPLDDRREWYRYHHLFADFLRTELDLQHTAALHLKAAHWFEAHDLMPEAVKHALASGDMTEAARIIVPAAIQVFHSGQYTTVLNWLDALLDEVVHASVPLASFKALALMATGQTKLAESFIQSAEAGLPVDASPVERGWVLSLRHPLLDSQERINLARKALDLMGDADPVGRSHNLHVLGAAQYAKGDITRAVATLREAHRLAQQHGHQGIAASTLGYLAMSMNSQGKRREALALCHGGVIEYVEDSGSPLPMAGYIYVALGIIEYATNNLAQAEHHFRTGLELGQQSAIVHTSLGSMFGLALVQYGLGRREEALATIQEMRHLAARAGERGWLAFSDFGRASLELQQGNTGAVEYWAERANLSLDEPLDRTRRDEYLLYTRLLLAQGQSDQALALLATLAHTAQEDGHYVQIITARIQQAVAEQMQGDEDEALARLEQALRLAAPEDYVRAFLDEGPIVAKLLPHVQHIAPQFVTKLLAAFGVDSVQAPLPPRQPPTLIEPLSKRELEVLRLLMTGFSVTDIAGELFIAVSTVRSHVKSIYSKLGVHSRYEAVERAKVLHLS